MKMREMAVDGLMRTRRMLEAGLAHLGMWTIPWLSRRMVVRLAHGLGWLGFHCSRQCRRLGMANLDVAFGDTKTETEKKWILRRSLDNFALVMLDLIWFTRHPVERMAKWFTITPGLKEEISIDAARIGVTGHFGNWEMVGRFWATVPGSIMSVAMPIKNAIVDQMLQKARQVTGQIIVERDGALKKLIRYLRGGGTVGLLLDQNTPPDVGGVFNTFFGLPASVSPAAGKLAALTDARVIMAFALPQEDGRYTAFLAHVMPPEELQQMDKQTAADDITQKITSYYEKVIREQPEYWLWSYKRWRFIPPGVPHDGFPFYAKPL